jgi:hypothetical protein
MNLAHAHKIQFQYAVTFGPTSLLFEDFGSFDCVNSNGDPPKTLHFTDVTMHKRALVVVAPCDQDIPVFPRETYRFQSAPGRPELEGRTAQVALVGRKDGMVLNMRTNLDTSALPRYDPKQGLGALVEVKRVWHLDHASFADRIAAPVRLPGPETRVRDLIVEVSKFWDATGRPRACCRPLTRARLPRMCRTFRRGCGSRCCAALSTRRTSGLSARPPRRRR